MMSLVDSITRSVTISNKCDEHACHAKSHTHTTHREGVIEKKERDGCRRGSSLSMGPGAGPEIPVVFFPLKYFTRFGDFQRLTPGWLESTKCALTALTSLTYHRWAIRLRLPKLNPPTMIPHPRLMIQRLLRPVSKPSSMPPSPSTRI